MKPLSLLLAVASALGQICCADEQSERSKELYQVFRQTAESFSFVSASKEEYRFQSAPLMQFALEGKTFGSVFTWQDEARRLAVIGTIGSIPLNGRDWEFIEFHLLKPSPINDLEIVGQPGKTWRPQVQSLNLKPIPDAPKVAPLARSRLVQMRALARQFSGTMKKEKAETQLRLLPQPLYRQDDSTEHLDSALFAFVHDLGTDPEILLRIESLDQAGKPTWHYQPVRFTWRALSLKHNEENVWDVEEFIGREAPLQTTPYITGLTKAIP